MPPACTAQHFRRPQTGLGIIRTRCQSCFGPLPRWNSKHSPRPSGSAIDWHESESQSSPQLLFPMLNQGSQSFLCGSLVAAKLNPFAFGAGHFAFLRTMLSPADSTLGMSAYYSLGFCTLAPGHAIKTSRAVRPTIPFRLRLASKALIAFFTNEIVETIHCLNWLNFLVALGAGGWNQLWIRALFFPAQFPLVLPSGFREIPQEQIWRWLRSKQILFRPVITGSRVGVRPAFIPLDIP